ncbi:MAG: response regulator [Tabrizicola sp.]|nr:response regulator [Tabrizicola sp.]
MAQRVLLVEDEANIAEAIRFLLSRDGWEVLHLPDGQRVLEAARDEAPVLIILDHMLPDRSGLDILTALKADPATAALPVLMLTAKSQGRDREAAERAGADLFMTKPFSNAEMLAAVRTLAGR